MLSDEQRLDSALFRRIERLNPQGKQELMKALLAIAADNRHLKESSFAVQPLFASYSDS